MTTSTGKETKLFFNGVEIKGMGKFDFHSFGSDKECKKAIEEIERLYVEQYGQVSIHPHGGEK